MAKKTDRQHRAFEISNCSECPHCEEYYSDDQPSEWCGVVGKVLGQTCPPPSWCSLPLWKD